MSTNFSHLFTNHVTLVITECTTVRYSEYPELDSYSEEEFVVSTRKLEEWLNDPVYGSSNASSFRYVERFFEEALAQGSESTFGSRKFSMGDTPEWWEAFTIDISEATDPLRTFNVEIHQGD